MEFPLPQETLASVIDAEAKLDAAKAAYEAEAARLRGAINEAWHGIHGVARFDIVLAESSASDLGPMLVTQVSPRTGHRRAGVEPSDIDHLSVTLLCRFLTKDGRWSARDVFVGDWEPFDGDDSKLPTEIPADLR